MKVILQVLKSLNHLNFFFLPPAPSTLAPLRFPPFLSAILLTLLFLLNFCLPFLLLLLPRIFLLNPFIHLSRFSSHANCFVLELSLLETAWLEPCFLFVAVSSKSVENSSADAKRDPRSAFPETDLRC